MNMHDVVATLILEKLSERKGIDFERYGNEIYNEIAEEVSDILKQNYERVGE